MGNENADADDRVVDVLGKVVAQLRANFVIPLASMAVRLRSRSGRAPFRCPIRDVAH